MDNCYSTRPATPKFKREFQALVNALNKTPEEFERALIDADPSVRNGVLGEYNIVHYVCLNANPDTDYLRVLFELDPEIFGQHLFGCAYNGEYRNTPLHIACERNPDLVSLLLCRVENARYLENFDGNTPLDIALLYNLKSVENFLNSHKVTAEDLMRYNNNSMDKSKMNRECVEYLEAHTKYKKSRELREATVI